jgi:hypothetical protein
VFFDGNPLKTRQYVTVSHCKGGVTSGYMYHQLYEHKSRNFYKCMMYLSCIYIYIHVGIQIYKLAIYIVPFVFDFLFLCNGRNANCLKNIIVNLGILVFFRFNIQNIAVHLIGYGCSFSFVHDVILTQNTDRNIITVSTSLLRFENTSTPAKFVLFWKELVECRNCACVSSTNCQVK